MFFPNRAATWHSGEEYVAEDKVGCKPLALQGLKISAIVSVRKSVRAPWFLGPHSRFASA